MLGCLSHPGYKDGMVACLGIVDEAEGKVILVDATPDLSRQLWAIQHNERTGRRKRPLDLAGILLTHAHTGHYAGLLQLGKEGADLKGVPVFCTPIMASFLRDNQPWAQLTTRGNISIQEIDPTAGGTSSAGSSSSSGDCKNGEDIASRFVRLTPSISFLPVAVPHRAELSDTVAFVISLSGPSPPTAAAMRKASSPPEDVLYAGEDAVSPRQTSFSSAGKGRSSGGVAVDLEKSHLKLLYCPDTDGWSHWKRSIRDWCDEVDVALLDATFYDRDELKGRDMREVSHPIALDTMERLEGCKADVVLVHLNHTNPLLTSESPERAKALAAGFEVGTFGMEWVPRTEEEAESSAKRK